MELIVGPSEEVIPHLREKHGLMKADLVFMDHWKRCNLWGCCWDHRSVMG